MRNLMRRFLTVVTLGAVFLMSSAGVALAHECYVANRSEKATKQLANSPMWLAENMATHASYLFTFAVVLEIPFDENWVEETQAVVTEDMLNEAVAQHLEQGLQTWVAFHNHHTLTNNPQTGEPTPAALMHNADGQGIDQWFSSELGMGMMAIAASLLP